MTFYLQLARFSVALTTLSIFPYDLRPPLRSGPPHVTQHECSPYSFYYKQTVPPFFCPSLRTSHACSSILGFIDQALRGHRDATGRPYRIQKHEFHYLVELETVLCAGIGYQCILQYSCGSLLFLRAIPLSAPLSFQFPSRMGSRKASECSHVQAQDVCPSPSAGLWRLCSKQHE